MTRMYHSQYAPNKFAECGKIVGSHSFDTSSVLIIDSGFYVVKGLVELKKSVFAGILIKKQCY